MTEPPKGRHSQSRHASMYKPYDTESHGFYCMSHGNVFVLHLDALGVHAEATLVKEDIPLLIEMLEDTKKLMEWQEKQSPSEDNRTLKKRPAPLFCTKCGKKNKHHY